MLAQTFERDEVTFFGIGGHKAKKLKAEFSSSSVTAVAGRDAVEKTT
jgi:hypothetical protein